MNKLMITNILGRIMCTEAVFMIPALLISLFKGEGSSALGFGLTIVLLAVAGIPCVLVKPLRKGFYARDGFVTVGLTWMVVSLFGALPYYISGAVPGFINAIFESVSGFTTTSASVISDVEALPMGILYWRSFSNWLGGMGVLVFILALTPIMKNSGESLYLLRAESPGIKIGKLVPRMHQSAKILYAIYIAMTVVEFIFLLAGGTPLFDSLSLALCTGGTGGFSIKNSGLAAYGNYTQTVIMVFMVLFSINFNIYHLLLIREFRRAYKNEELRVFFGILLFSIAAITINSVNLYDSVGDALHHSAFQVVSIMSTTGFHSVDFNIWPEFSRVILIILMLFGACSGSTSGGMKVSRIMVMFKSVKRSIYTAMNPNAVKLIHMDGELLEERIVTEVQNYILIYFIITALCTLLIAVDGYTIETNLSAAIACISNIGPGLGAVGTTTNYVGFSSFSKITLSLVMLFGRLELYPMLVLFRPSTWKR